MKRASTWLGPGALPSALSKADFRSCMEYCWTCVQSPPGTRGAWRPRTAWKPGRSTGRLSYSSRQKARTANITSWASVRSVWVLRTRTFQRPEGPGASTEKFSAGVMSVRPQKNRKSFNPSPHPLPVLHEVYSKFRFHWSCANGLGILAHPTGSVRGHNLASMDKEMVYVT